MSADTVLSGSLKDFGLVEVLQVVELGGMTGAIHLKQNNGRMGVLYCNEGKMVNCSEFDPGALTLGDVLQQLGMTTYHHIEQAYSQQLQDLLGRRIGERLRSSADCIYGRHHGRLARRRPPHRRACALHAGAGRRARHRHRLARFSGRLSSAPIARRFRPGARRAGRRARTDVHGRHGGDAECRKAA